MLQIKNLTATHRKDGRVILRDVSFTLGPDDRAVLVGEEGDGKSTLLKLIHDPSLVETYADFTGEIVKGCLSTGYLAQELPEDSKELTVGECFSGLTPEEIFSAFPEGFHAGLPASEQKVGTLSGGEKVRLQLARILLERPDILLLDEPSNDLDLETVRWLERFLNTCGLPVLYVSHDETLIENTANVVIHLEQLRRKTEASCTVARMPYRQYVQERERRIARQTQQAQNARGEYEKQQEKYRRIESQVEHRQGTISRADPHGGKMLKRKMKAVKSMGRRLEREHENDAAVPDTEEAVLVRFGEDCRIPNGKAVLDFQTGELRAGEKLLARNISLHISGPQKVGIVGRNGAGKTALLRLIAAALLPRQDIRAAYMPQDYEELLRGAATPVEFLAPSGRKDDLTKARTFLGSMKYTADEMEHGAGELSGGQKAKLLFLRMIFEGANVLILDEPTRNLSPLSAPVIRTALRSFGGTIISVSHDRRYLAEVCTCVYRLTETGLEPSSANSDDIPPEKTH